MSLFATNNGSRIMARMPEYTFGNTSSPLLLIVVSRPARWEVMKSKILKYDSKVFGKLSDVAEQDLRIRKTGINVNAQSIPATRLLTANLTARLKNLLLYNALKEYFLSKCRLLLITFPVSGQMQ